MRLEDLSVFKITKCEKNGLKTVLIQGVPEMHLINHGLKKTKFVTGKKRTIEIVSEPEVFNRMAVWHKAADSESICIELASSKMELIVAVFKLPMESNLLRNCLSVL